MRTDSLVIVTLRSSGLRIGQVNVDFVDVRTGLLFGFSDWNSSDNGYFFQNWNRNRHISSDGNSFVNRILNVINIILLEIFLDYWLSDHFFSRKINRFLADDIVDLSSFSNWVQLNSLVVSSLNLEINQFLLNERKHISGFGDFSSRSINSLNFFLFSNL